MIDTTAMSVRDRGLIERSVWTLKHNIIQNADGSSPFGACFGIAPSVRTYPGVWNWDAAFHLLAVSRFDAELARDQARILFSRQLENGQLADVLFADGRSVFRFTKPPVFAWAVMEADKRAPDNAFLSHAFTHLKKNLSWWERERSDGAMFFYRISPMESGWDNSPRFDFPNQIGWCYAIDLNCYMVLFYEAMAYFAVRLDLPQQAQGYLAKRQRLEQEIETRLFDEKHGYYCDYSRILKRFTKRISPASFLPLFTQTASIEHAEAMAKLATSEFAFYPGLPTIAYSDTAYRSYQYWRGPTWLNTAYFAILGLNHYGRKTLALELTETILNWCAQNAEAIYEYYDSRTGKGLGARDFGWSSAFIIELVHFKYATQRDGES